MLNSKKNRFKPIFKKFLRLRENIQNQKKLFKFQKKKKWRELIKHYKRKLRRYKKYAPIDQTRYLVTKFPNKGTSYKKRYRDTLHSNKKFKVLYGGFLKKYFKNQIKKTTQNNYILKNKIKENSNLLFITIFESRLDTVLYRANFVYSIRTARQLIVHGKIFINNNQIRSKNYILKAGDIIHVDQTCNPLINKNSWKKLKSKPLWPLPQNHLHINYKTMEIIFGIIKWENLSASFTFHLQLEKILLNSRYQ